MLATAVSSVCAEPPTLLACVNRSARSFKVIDETGKFCVNVLDRNQHEIAQRFLSLDSVERCKLCSWTALETGAPAVEGALVNFDCTVADAVEVGTHTIFLGRVVATRVNRSGNPLLYYNGDYASLREALAPA